MKVHVAAAPDSPRSAALAREPRRLGPWRLVQKLGEGAWAEVFQARPARAPDSWPADYALKVLKPAQGREPFARELLAREAEVGREVSHPRLIAVLSAELEAPPYYVVLPCLHGATVKDVLARRAPADGPRRPFATPHALWIARQAAEALQALHRQGWLHSDVKPGNLFVTPLGHATLLDLGFCRRHGATHGAARCEGRRQSAPDHLLMASFRYAAPETFSSAIAPGPPSDVYSLGATLYEMLTGESPFPGDDAAALAAAHLKTPAPDPRRLAPHLPRSAASLLKRMLAKEPLRRPHLEELISQLARAEIETFAERFEVRGFAG